jgi:hypothetical protein
VWIALATVLAGAAPAQPPVELPVERVAVELRGREQLRAAITAPAWPAGAPRTFATERLILDAVRQWRFEPARDPAGKPVEIKWKVTLAFKLQ